ncbi:MAG: DUF6127 family protein [Reyranella sp.]|nr:DUF6127 family protein [Reyranella sp.]
MSDHDHSPISMPRGALEVMLENAAERGARKALASVGLDDAQAADHIRGLRDLFAMYRVVRNGALKQIGQGIALVVIGALVFFASTKLKQ